MLGLAVHHRSTRRGDAFEVMHGNRRAAPPIPLGRARRPVGAAVIAWFAISAGAPMGMLAWASLQPFYQPPALDAVDALTFDRYRELFADPALSGAVWRSLALGAVAATVVVVLGCLVAWIVVRTRVPGRYLLDALTLAPLVMPGLVLGLAIAVVWLRVPVDVYGTPAILLIAYVTVFLPYGSRYAGAAIAGLGSDLEDAARIAGASWWMSLRRIVVPLIGPGLAAAWLTIVVLTLRELSVSLLLYQPGREVFPVLIWERWEDGRLADVAALGLFQFAVLAAALGAAYALARRVVVPSVS
jgi:iron(III) transport system permease protein